MLNMKRADVPRLQQSKVFAAELGLDCKAPSREVGDKSQVHTTWFLDRRVVCLVLAVSHGLWGLGSPSRDSTPALHGQSAESQPLDCQRIP